MSAVRIEGELTKWFRVTMGVRQGCGLSLYLFNVMLEVVMNLALKDTEIGVNINGQMINNLRVADGKDLVAEERHRAAGTNRQGPE